jgi:[acyl-carrier-protein] S-malonyltransferase
MALNNKTTVFLFPGQGAQYRGMALDFFETGGPRVKHLFALASELMDRDMRILLGESDDGTLKRSDIAQPAITLANLAAAIYLEEQGVEPAGCAGFSLGEYAALAVAGAVGLEDCFRMVRARGRAMQDAADRIEREASPGQSLPPSEEGTAPGMAAVIGLSPEQVEALIAEWTNSGLSGLYAANFNSPRQVVVSGTAAALALARERFKQAGARRVIRLQVAGPFHSPLIAEAADRFGPVLESVPFRDPLIPLYSNVSGKRVSSGAEAKELALKQITCPVRWTAEERAIAASGVQVVLETGPGQVLQGLWKEAGVDIPCYAAGTVEQAAVLFKEYSGAPAG